MFHPGQKCGHILFTKNWREGTDKLYHSKKVSITVHCTYFLIHFAQTKIKHLALYSALKAKDMIPVEPFIRNRVLGSLLQLKFIMHSLMTIMRGVLLG